ncbi:sugar ABC transporter permease [Micrococcales bacterium 31B]|nr:sugar ABC transporter permease [Micrococcales bacterium 31B]
MTVKAGSPAPPRAVSTRQPPRRRNSRKLREYLTFVAFLLPNLALLTAFVYSPLFQNFYNSTLDWNLGGRTFRKIGLGNYVEWFTDPNSWTVIKVTLIFTIATVGGSMLFGLLMALVLNQKLRGTVFARSAIFAPYVLSGVGVGIVWLFIFDPTYGALSGVLAWVGTSGPNWYQQPGPALAMIIIVYIWKNLGYCAVVYLAALQSVRGDVLEAAQLDGANRFQRFTRITFPLLSPTTFFLSVTTILNSLQAFDIISIMTRGGPPVNATTTLIYQVYDEAFTSGRAGYSAAVSSILFVVLLVVTLVQMLYLEKKVHYV